MKRILITGATGNIGAEVVQYICEFDTDSEIIAAVRNVATAKRRFPNLPNLAFRPFDFEHRESFRSAFKEIDLLFLLRPPHISQVDRYFKPLVQAAQDGGIERIVFLSVQGAEKSSVIPHHKIEKLITSFGFEYIFVRPSYFMQNLTTTLLTEILENKTITLPSGAAKFNWIDTKNIGEATARLITSFEKFQNNAYEITGTENRNFREVAELMSAVIGTAFTYKSINPIRFYFMKRNQGIESGFAVVMAMLHFLPRLQNEPVISDNFKMLTGKEPTTLKEFIEREKDKFL